LVKVSALGDNLQKEGGDEGLRRALNRHYGFKNNGRSESKRTAQSMGQLQNEYNQDIENRTAWQ